MTFSHVTSADSAKLKELASVLAKSQKVVMITGAGISTSCGIPDFRSKDGLYSLMQAAHNGNMSGQHPKIKGADMFNANLFRDEQQTRSFYRFIAALRGKIRATKKSSTTHRLIRKLRDNGKLVRCYTQNIDGFEAREDLCCDLSRGPGSRRRMEKKVLATAQSPISTSPGGVHDTGCEVVPLHGDLATVRCTVCRHERQWTAEEQRVFAQGESPTCPECQTQDEVRKVVGKRGIRIGSLRPNIVLYGEDHRSTDTITEIRQNDMKMKPDLLLVMGTSLKVDGLKMLVREFANAVHQKKNGRVVFVNMTPPAASVWGDVFDTWVDMDCDGWVSSMKTYRPEIWQTQSHLDADEPIDLLNVSTVRAHRVPRRYDPTRLGSGLDRRVRVVVECDHTNFEDFKEQQRKRKSAHAECENGVSRKRRRVSSSSSGSKELTGMPSEEAEDTYAADTIVVSPHWTPKGEQNEAESRSTGQTDCSFTRRLKSLSSGQDAVVTTAAVNDTKARSSAAAGNLPAPYDRKKPSFTVYSDERLAEKEGTGTQSHALAPGELSRSTRSGLSERPVKAIYQLARPGNATLRKREAPAPRKRRDKGGSSNVLRVGQGRVMKPKGSGRQTSGGMADGKSGLLQDKFTVSRKVWSENSPKLQPDAEKENLA